MYERVYILLAMKLNVYQNRWHTIISALKNMWNDVNTISPIAQGVYLPQDRITSIEKWSLCSEGANCTKVEIQQFKTTYYVCGTVYSLP